MKARLLLPLTALLLCRLPASAAPPALPPAPAAAPPVRLPPAPPAPAPPSVSAARPPGRVQGRVSAIDPIKRTLTVDPRGAAAPVTVTLAPDAKVLLAAAGTLASLKVGDRIAAYGTVTPDAPVLTTDRIVVLPAQVPGVGRRTATSTTGFHPKRVEGTITALAPALMLTTAGHVAVTVTPGPRVRVETATAGTLADIRVGQTVTLQMSPAATAALPVASEVRVMPARVKGNRGTKKGTTPNAPSVPLAPLPISAP